MINIVDRAVEHAGRYTLTNIATDQVLGTFDLSQVPGLITEAGTDMNRAVFMAMQGFIAQTTTFNADGSISETNAAGEILTTVFNADGSITTTFTAGTMSISKQTTFNSNGSISEVIL